MSDETKSSPRHYSTLRPEPIEAIEGWGLTFSVGNAVKYIARAGRKPGESVLDDLRKARWYLDREITRLERADAATLEAIKAAPAARADR